MSNGASNGVKVLIFNGLLEILEYGNGAGSSFINIISNEIHDRVSEMLEILVTKLKRAELFEKIDLSKVVSSKQKISVFIRKYPKIAMKIHNMRLLWTKGFILYLIVAK